MSTLDDRILGEKLQYYCSSSEDEEEEQSDPEDDDGDAEASGGGRVVQDASVNCASQELRPWEGSSTNTGPKGVLKDWRNFKQMETEKRKEKEKERLQLAKKLALTCRSNLDDEKAEAAKTEAKDEVDSMLDAAVLESYIAQRMQEMMEHAMVSVGPKFGRVVQLKSTDQFLKEVDEEDKKVTVIIHIYRKGAPGCDAVSGCFSCLAHDYPYVKFCELSAATAHLSSKFAVDGVPALLVYRGGLMTSNFVRLTDSLGDDFYATDLESFLVEHASLPDRSLVPASCIRSGAAAGHDSDVSLDD